MSTTTQDVDKAELIDKATDLARHGRGTGGPPHDQVDALLHAYYLHVAPEDIVDRTDRDVYGALASHFKLAANRPQGTAQMRAFTPTLAEALLQHDELAASWRARHVVMVERMIGSKSGTGGSSGSAYLRGRLPLQYFPILWTLRSEL